MAFQTLSLARQDTLPMREHIATPLTVPAQESVSSQHLLNGRREVLIRHGDSVYRLRHTSNDKLILTK